MKYQYLAQALACGWWKRSSKDSPNIHTNISTKEQSIIYRHENTIREYKNEQGNGNIMGMGMGILKFINIKKPVKNLTVNILLDTWSSFFQVG